MTAQNLSELNPAFSYPETVALAKSRAVFPESVQATKAEDARDRVIYVVGPPYTKEVFLSGGVEIRKSMPFCYIFDRKEAPNPKSLLPMIALGRLTSESRVQILVYNADQPQPVFKLDGSLADIRNSQYPFSDRDAIVITVTNTR